MRCAMEDSRNNARTPECAKLAESKKDKPAGNTAKTGHKKSA